MKRFYLHGMGGTPADWDAVLQHAPGYALAIPLEPSFEAATAALATTLRQEAGPVSLVGYSMGGRFAVAVAELLCFSGHPPAQVVLLSAGLGFPHEAERAERCIIDEQWAELARRDLSAFWRQWYAQPLFSSFAQLAEAAQTTWLKARNIIDSRTLTAHLCTYSPARHDHLLPAIRRLQASGVSLLYLAGERDKKYVAVGRELAAASIPTQVIGGAGHALPLEAPIAVAQAINAR